ncbi:hypothetical protein BH23BAC1_BH23BAC1_25000 [soil metagenome]
MYKTLYLSPMLPSSNITGTVSFFTELLQFKTELLGPTYAIVYKDKFTIHIIKSDGHLNELEFYMQVDNVDEVWDLLKVKENELRIKGPINQEYGMREIHIEVPYTKSIMFIGQEANH